MQSHPLSMEVYSALFLYYIYGTYVILHKGMSRLEQRETELTRQHTQTCNQKQVQKEINTLNMIIPCL